MADRISSYVRYTNKFGNPKHPDNKKWGHKIMNFGKWKGVAVPGEYDEDN